MSDNIVQERSIYFLDQFENNRLARDLQKGLKAMRGFLVTEGGSVSSSYLPQFPEEPKEIYSLRLSRSYLTNYAKRAITSDSGKILANRAQIVGKDNDLLPDEYYSWLDDIDLIGTDDQTFLSNEMQKAAWKGVTLSFVDCIKDEDSDEFRPFVRAFDIDDVLDFKSSRLTGRLTYIKFATQMEDDSEDAMFSSAQKSVVFEVTPTTWSVYDMEEGDNGEPFDGGEIIRYKDGSKRIENEIPVAIFYTNKQGHLIGESPYQTLMELTIEHFQSNSEIKNAETYALQPILFGKDMPSDFEMKAVASYRGIFIDPQGAGYSPDLKWVETDTAAIKQARDGLKDLESRIATFSIDANSIRPSGNVTATEKSIDAAGSNAALRAFSVGLAQYMQNIIEYMSSYTLNPVEVEVDIRPDFSLTDNLETTNTLIEMKKEGIISKRAVVEESIQNKTLSKDFDYETDQEWIAKENELSIASADAVADGKGEVENDADYTTVEKEQEEETII